MNDVNSPDPGVARIENFVRQMSNNLAEAQEKYIQEQMEKNGLTKDMLENFVLEYYPIEISYDKVTNRLTAKQNVRLRHLTEKEIENRDKITIEFCVCGHTKINHDNFGCLFVACSCMYFHK